MKYFIVLFIAFVFVACSDDYTRSGHLLDNKREQAKAALPVAQDTMIFLRVMILESHTITHVVEKETIASVYRPNDTIWVNQTYHIISDNTDSTAMKAVLLK